MLVTFNVHEVLFPSFFHSNFLFNFSLLRFSLLKGNNGLKTFFEIYIIGKGGGKDFYDTFRAILSVLSVVGRNLSRWHERSKKGIKARDTSLPL